MYIVGLSTNNKIHKVYTYETREEAIKEFKDYKHSLKNNNYVTHSEEIITRNECDTVISVDLHITTNYLTEMHLFMCKATK